MCCNHVLSYLSGLLGPYFPRRHTKVIVSSKSVARPAVPELNMFLHPSFLDSPKVSIPYSFIQFIYACNIYCTASEGGEGSGALYTTEDRPSVSVCVVLPRSERIL